MNKEWKNKKPVVMQAEGLLSIRRSRMLRRAEDQNEPAPSDFNSNLTVTTNYFGNKVYVNNQLKYVLTEEGYIEKATGSNTYTAHYYLNDRLGNHRIVMDASGTVKQVNNYYPSGTSMAESPRRTDQGVQPYKFGGKELDRFNTLDHYDFEARAFDPTLMRFTSPDPLAEKYYSISPYAYCANNPVNAVDPTGRSTYVINNGDGTYRIIGGNLDDKDLNIYSINFKDGKYAGMSSIGETTSITSFYDSDANDGKGAWALGSVIDPNDNRGKQFLDNMVKDDPEIGYYMDNATTNKKYDFKATNGTNQVLYTDKKDYYRGMPVQTTKDGTVVYTSARDVGNIAAGYIAGAYGIPWAEARKEFDKLESKQQGHPAIEGRSTQNAQLVGWKTGYRDAQAFPVFTTFRWIISIPTLWKRITK